MKRTFPVLVLITLLAGTSVFPSAMADGHADSGWRHGDDHDGHGHWDYGWHDGHLGWLWVVGSALLIYDVTRPALVPQPSTVLVQATTPDATPPVAPAPAGYWYFCPSSGSYYPYVQTCPDGWETVPAAPPPSNN